MATTFYLTNDTSTTFYSNDEYDWVTTRGNAAVTATGVGTSDGFGGWIGATIENPAGTPIYWITPRLNAVTLSSNPTVNLRMAESNMAANYVAGFQVDEINGLTGALVKGVISSSNGVVELGTTESAQNWSPTIGSGSITAGNRLRLTVYTTIITAGGAYTATLWFDGPTAAASGDSYITFVENLTTYTPPSDQPYISPYRQILGQ